MVEDAENHHEIVRTLRKFETGVHIIGENLNARFQRFLQLADATHAVVIGVGMINGDYVKAKRFQKESEVAIGAPDIENARTLRLIEQRAEWALEQAVQHGDVSERVVGIPGKLGFAQLGF